MREEEEEEEERSWFARWEEELPSPEELMPLSQTLITPNLAHAFDIPTSGTGGVSNHHHPPPPPPPLGGADEEAARTLKRPRLVWTPQLHKRFVEAVAHLGIKNAVPKTIMQLMSVDGLTRENVASHLQKYRLYLKRMQQGFNSPSDSDSSATDHLFAASPNHYFTRPPLPAAAAAAAAQQHLLPYYALNNMTTADIHYHHHHHHQRQIGHFAPAAVGFDLAHQQPRMAGFISLGAAHTPPPQTTASYTNNDLDSRAAGGGSGAIRVLTLFPTGDD